MLTKTVTGRKCLNAMIRHLAFHGSVEIPWEFEQHFEHKVFKQLVADGKVSTSRSSYGEVVLTLKDGTLYPEEESSKPDRLVVYLALDNPKNEHLAKVYRKNHVVEELPESNEYVALDNGDF